MDEREQLMNTVLLIVVIGAPTIGVLIMALGPVLSFVAGLLHWLADIGADMTVERARRRNELREQRHQQRLADLAAVNRFDDAAPVVMSRAELGPVPSELRPASGPRTDAPPVLPTAREVTYAREQLLDIYTSLRAHGYSRDDARALLRLVRVPLHNDLWSHAGQVATPDDADYATPIAGRPTRRAYYPDSPELDYQEP